MIKTCYQHEEQVHISQTKFFNLFLEIEISWLFLVSTAADFPINQPQKNKELMPYLCDFTSSNIVKEPH